MLSADPAGAWDVREQVTHGDWIVPTIHNVYRSDYQPYAAIRFHKVGGDLKVRGRRVAPRAAERRPRHPR